MNEETGVAARIAAVAGARATVRLDDTRASVILDVSGLDPAARDALESEVREAAGIGPDLAAVEKLRRAFVSGEPIPQSAVVAVV